MFTLFIKLFKGLMTLTMIVTVYEWSGTKLMSFGHISVKLSDNTYISWWPEDSTSSISLKAAAGQRFSAKYFESLEDEINETGAGPMRTIYIVKGLDEEKMKQYFKGLLNGSLKWDLEDKSCASVTYAALCEGSDWFKDKVIGRITPSAVATLADAFANGDLDKKKVKGSCLLV